MSKFTLLAILGLIQGCGLQVPQVKVNQPPDVQINPQVTPSLASVITAVCDPRKVGSPDSDTGTATDIVTVNYSCTNLPDSDLSRIYILKFDNVHGGVDIFENGTDVSALHLSFDACSLDKVELQVQSQLCIR